MSESSGSHNNNNVEILEMLRNAKTVAVVGISDKSERSSYGVAEYLSRFYTIIPVNPNLKSWLGLKCYPSLQAVPAEVQIDLVDIFRKSEDVGEVVDDAIARSNAIAQASKIKYIWMQQGIINTEAAERAQKAGMKVVMDACIAVLHSTLVQSS